MAVDLQPATAQSAESSVVGPKAGLLEAGNPAPASSSSPGAPASGLAGVAAWSAVASRMADAPESVSREPLPLREPVGTQRWQEELGNRVTLMTAQGRQSGSLHLNPEHLGPVEVHIDMGEEGARVQFGAQHAETRQALQDALPRLREMFTEAGLSLQQAGVSQHAPRHDRPAPQAASAYREDGRSDGEPTPAGEHLVRSVTHTGLLDTYA